MNEWGDTGQVALTGADAAGGVAAALADAEGIDVERIDRQALPDRLDDGAFDAVVVGDEPPDSDAVDVLREVRGRGYEMPVVAVGTVDADRIEAALTAGMSDYVQWREDAGVELIGRLRALCRHPWRDGAVQAARWDAVLGAFAHDARNPLNVVTGRLELLDVEEPHGEAMDRSLRRVESLVDEVSSAAAVSGPLGETASVRLSDIADEVWSSLDAPEATLTVERDGSLTADRDRLAVVLERLFENAVVHAGPDVTVTVGITDRGFYVADDGPGVPPEHRNRAFEQGYGTARTGEGYGLFVVARAAGAHGWTVDLGESDDGGARVDVAVR